MREYYGTSAQQYGQPQDKYFTLFPAIQRALPHARQGHSVLDLGCGTGVLVGMFTDLGYSYTGVDISQDMLNEAKKNHPTGNFLLGDATKSLPTIDNKFNIVIANMLLPSIGSKDAFNSVFATTSTVLKQDGIFVVTAGHPCFDGYMQKHFFNREDIETQFQGYFHSPTEYQVHRALKDRSFTFTDFHWTLSDYFMAAKKAGLRITAIDECPLTGEAPQTVIEKVSKKGAPSYILFVFQK